MASNSKPKNFKLGSLAFILTLSLINIIPISNCWASAEETDSMSWSAQQKRIGFSAGSAALVGSLFYAYTPEGESKPQQGSLGIAIGAFVGFTLANLIWDDESTAKRIEAENIYLKKQLNLLKEAKSLYQSKNEESRIGSRSKLQKIKLNNKIIPSPYNGTPQSQNLEAWGFDEAFEQTQSQ